MNDGGMVDLGACYRSECAGRLRPSIYEMRWCDGERCDACNATWYFIAPIPLSEVRPIASPAPTGVTANAPDGSNSSIT